jgi:integrase/recombinase XerD
VPRDVGAFGPLIDSFEIDMLSGGRSARTREMYLDAVRWFAGWLTAETSARRWPQVGRDELRQFFVHMAGLDYQQSYRNNIGRCLQAFFKWLAEEEEIANPYDRFKPPTAPKLGTKMVQVLAIEDMRRLIKDAEAGRDFESRRDAALLRLFACTGCRLSEITHLRVADVDVKDRTAVVTGKGGKSRQVKFDHKCALALDRYLRKRAEHPAAGLDALWLGVRRRVAMTRSGIYQVIERRGERLGLRIHPHMFRHTFSHNWLDAGGAEGDLMELNGWDSPQMLRHYGASARSARARRAYDRVNVMGDL